MLLGTNQAPSLHILKKTLYGPCDEARALAKAARGARWTDEIAPVFFGNKIIGSVYGDRQGRIFASKMNALDLMGFPNGYADVVAAVRAGQTGTYQFFSLNNSGMFSNVWADLWNTQGSTLAASYSGTANTARQFDNTSDGAFYIGEPVSPKTKHLISARAGTGTGNDPGLMLWVYDRVLSYDKCTITNATQTMTNTLTAQRWTGAGFPGLRMICTPCVTASGATATRWTSVIYANEIGTATRTVPLTLQLDMIPSTFASNTLPATLLLSNVASAIGDIGPFFPLQKSDIGVSSLTSYVQSAANTGDSCYALIRPLVMWVGPPTGNVVESDFVRERLVLPRIYDTACISMLCCTGDNSQPTFTLSGSLTYAWN